MIQALVILALCLLVAMLVCSLALVLVAFIGTLRQERRERQDAHRLARYAEHMAAQNGRPKTDGVLSRATRRDR